MCDREAVRIQLQIEERGIVSEARTFSHDPEEAQPDEVRRHRRKLDGADQHVQFAPETQKLTVTTQMVAITLCHDP